MTWRVLEAHSDDIYSNLSVDEAMARVCAESENKMNTLRLWKSKNAVVIGRFQCVHEEVNLEFCRQNDIAIARRFTGGGAVYHDMGNLNFVICGDQRHEHVSRNLMEFYDTFLGAVTGALNTLSIPALYDQKRNCIRVNGKKITGTAGWIKSGVSFLHGTLLIDADLTNLENTLRPPQGQPKYLRDRSRIRCKPSVRDVVTNLIHEANDLVTEEEIRRALIDSVQETVGEDLRTQDLTEEERAASERLYQERYSQPSWNLGILAQTDL